MNDLQLREKSRLNKKASGIMLVLFLVGSSSLILSIQPAGAESGIIYIRADGSVEGTTSIVSYDNNVTYVFTADINYSYGIYVQRNNTILDGSGHILTGPGVEFDGISVMEVSNVTIKNISVHSFVFGIYLFLASGNTIIGNNVTENEVGIGLNSGWDNTVSGNTVTGNNAQGIYLYSGPMVSSNHNNISGNNVTENNQDGIHLDYSFNNTVSGNKITANTYDGIWLGSSSNNTVSGNKIAENNRGIAIDSSSHNIISGNNMTANNEFGISLFASSGNSLASNAMSSNMYNFGVNGYVPSDFVNHVDASNTVDGKPICYWTNEVDLTVPSNAGFVVLVNCTGITVRNLSLTNNLEGIGLIYTSNSTIAGNKVAKCGYGIALGYSQDITVSGNNVTDNDYVGITLMLSSGNSISGNGVMGNSNGIRTFGNSSNNMIFHNNFVDNGLQAASDTLSINAWDNGVEGNYWSDYIGVDLNPHDGIGDSSYVIDANNQDNYPLMAPYIPGDYNHDGTVNMTDVDLVRVAWQSRISDLNYNPHVDFNMDGINNIKDASIIGVNWQKHV